MCFDSVKAEMARLAAEKGAQLSIVTKQRNDANQLLMAEAEEFQAKKRGRKKKAPPAPVIIVPPPPIAEAKPQAKKKQPKVKRRPVLPPRADVFCDCGNKISELMPRHTKTCSAKCRKKRSLQLAFDRYQRKKQEEGWYKDRRKQNRAAYVERRGPKKCKFQECQRPLDINDPKQTCSDRCRRELIRISVRRRRYGIE